MDNGHTLLDESTMRENLRKARISRGLTQAQVADILEISVTAYQKMEQGKTRLINENYLRCAGTFGISASELVNGYKPVRDASATIADMEQSYNEKIREKDKDYIEAIQLRETEIGRLKEIIKDKEQIISTQALLITQLMKNNKD